MSREMKHQARRMAFASSGDLISREFARVIRRQRRGRIIFLTGEYDDERSKRSTFGRTPGFGSREKGIETSERDVARADQFRCDERNGAGSH